MMAYMQLVTLCLESISKEMKSDAKLYFLHSLFHDVWTDPWGYCSVGLSFSGKHHLKLLYRHTQRGVSPSDSNPSQVDDKD